jgi:signal transduction histidine kinase
MTQPSPQFEQRCASAIRQHLESGDERTLNEAYEVGRTALAEGLGVLDVALLLSRATAVARAGGEAPPAPLLEAFMLECLSPFEMAHRGAWEANGALRRMDERREELLRSIAHELHDETGQLIAVLHRALEALRPHLVPGGGAHLERGFALLREIEDQIRRLVHELRPVILDDLGLAPALRFLAEGIEQRSGVSVSVAGSTGGRLPMLVETALYRGAQEALTNVARHARATRASVALERTEREVLCRIRDDGQGFDAAALAARQRPRGIGLEGIRERLMRLGGALAVRSQPGCGTELTLRIPIEVSHDEATAIRG